MCSRFIVNCSILKDRHRIRRLDVRSGSPARENNRNALFHHEHGLLHALLLICLELKPNSYDYRTHYPSWVCSGIVIGPSEERIYSNRHEIENNDPDFHCCWNDNSSSPNWVEHLHKYCGRIPCQLSVKSDSHTLQRMGIKRRSLQPRAMENHDFRLARQESNSGDLNSPE